MAAFALPEFARKAINAPKKRSKDSAPWMPLEIEVKRRRDGFLVVSLQSQYHGDVVKD